MPYVLPAFFFGCVLMARKAQFQGLALVIVSVYVADALSFWSCVLVALAMAEFGRFTNAGLGA